MGWGREELVEGFLHLIFRKVWKWAWKVGGDLRESLGPAGVEKSVTYLDGVDFSNLVAPPKPWLGLVLDSCTEGDARLVLGVSHEWGVPHGLGARMICRATKIASIRSHCSTFDKLLPSIRSLYAITSREPGVLSFWVNVYNGAADPSLRWSLPTPPTQSRVPTHTTHTLSLPLEISRPFPLSAE